MALDLIRVSNGGPVECLPLDSDFFQVLQSAAQKLSCSLILGLPGYFSDALIPSAIGESLLEELLKIRYLLVSHPEKSSALLAFVERAVKENSDLHFVAD